MIKRQRLSYILWEHYKNLPVKQVYAWIYIKALHKIIIVSKDNNKWQMPGGKPKTGENHLQTLYREVLEETSINLNTFCKKLPICFGFYLIEENKERYLQLRYFIELENLSINCLHPNENETENEDNIKYIKLVNIYELQILIPWMKHNNELKDFLTMLGKNILSASILRQYDPNFFGRSRAKTKRYIDIFDVYMQLKNQLGNYSKDLLISFLMHSCLLGDYDDIIDKILSFIMGISFYTFSHNQSYQNYIRCIFDYRMLQYQYLSVKQYESIVINNIRERQILIGYISPSTSYFFRDKLQDEFYTIQQYLPNYVQVLILGCSTGAEVYSVAYCLQSLNIQYNIIATDINQYSIEYAQQGIYPSCLIEDMEPNIKNSLFDKNQIKSTYKQDILFKTLNILKFNEYPHKKFDLVIVRNVLKYFHQKGQQTIINNIMNIIKDKSLIMVGIQNGSNKDSNLLDICSCQLIGKYTYAISHG